MQDFQAEKNPLLAARAIFRRAAIAMLIIAGIELAVTVWNMVQQPGTFSINLAMLVGAAMLFSGNLRAVSLVRWLSAAYVPIAALWLFLVIRQPADLTFAYLRLYPFQVFMLVVVALVHWLMAVRLLRELGKPEVLAARAAAGKKLRDMRIPIALGAAGVVAGIIFNITLLGGERATRAAALAQQKAGSNYKVHVDSINVVKQLNGGEHATFVNASVAAWNDSVVVHVPVSWREP